MKCRQVRELIADSLHGGPGKIRDSEAAEHVKNCPRCRAILEEYKLLENLTLDQPAWQPDEFYWNSLLPRIHVRIEKKNEPAVPSWIYRSLAPAAAIALVVVLSLSLLRFNGGTGDLLPADISESDIASYIEEKSVIDSYITNDAETADAIGRDDATVIYDLLKNESHIASYYEDKAGSIFETVNEEEAEQLFALLSDDVK